MYLSQQDREKIYFEEKSLRESKSKDSFLMISMTIGALIGFASVLLLSNSNHKNRVSIDNLRKAYSGLAPDEEI